MDLLAHPLDDELFGDLVDFAFDRGADRMHLRAGCLPLLGWHGRVREVNCRKLTEDDTAAIMEALLAWMCVPEGAREAGDAAVPLAFLCRPPGDGLLQVNLRREEGDLSLAIDLIRPLEP